MLNNLRATNIYVRLYPFYVIFEDVNLVMHACMLMENEKSNEKHFNCKQNRVLVCNSHIHLMLFGTIERKKSSNQYQFFIYLSVENLKLVNSTNVILLD